MDRRIPLLISVLCGLAACEDVPEAAPSERIASTKSALQAEPKPPEREIAIDGWNGSRRFSKVRVQGGGVRHDRC